MKIPKQLIADYACVSVAYMAMIIVMHPIYFGSFYVTQEGLILLIKEAAIAFSSLMISEAFVTYVLRKPFCYSDELSVRFHHFLICAIITIPLSTAMLNQLLVATRFGWGHWDYAWIDYDGVFSLKWYINKLLPCIVCSAMIQLIVMPIISQIRTMLISLRELKEINQLLEMEQAQLRPHQSDNLVDNKIILHGDSRESLIVRPLDIMYVESVGNYLSIVYFNDSDLCQKRLRSSLKEVKDTLDRFPFMLQIHRAFLVNINFITQVSGNSAGYKINLFSTDRILPVSKANVAQFRGKIKELGKNHL